MLEVVSGCFGAILAKNLTKLCPDRRVQFMFPASTRRKQRAPECNHPKVHDYKAPAPMKRLVKLPALLEAAPWHLRSALPVGVDDAKTERVVQDFVKARAQGYDPKVDVVVSCMASSDRFKLTMVNMMPCITASRGQSRGFYISTKGDRISMDDMLRCHGIPPSSTSRSRVVSATGPSATNSEIVSVAMCSCGCCHGRCTPQDVGRFLPKIVHPPPKKYEKTNHR